MEVSMKLLQRRKEALALLQKQLESGFKTNNPKERVNGITRTQQKKDTIKVPLTAKDIKRIQKEISNLEFNILNS